MLRLANIVESIQQAVSDEVIDWKFRPEALIVARFAFFQIDRESVILCTLGALHDCRDFFISQPYSQKSILGRVVGEDICE